jgi:Skp family chaperone for outer membrane proteins
MHMKKNEAQRSMSNDGRIAILETAFININSTLLDMRRAFDKMESKFESKLDTMDKKVESKLDAMDKKFESKLDAMDKKFESKLDIIDKKFESKLDAMDKKFDSKFDILHNRLWSNFLWLMSMIIGLAGLIAHTQHWF